MVQGDAAASEAGAHAYVRAALITAPAAMAADASFMPAHLGSCCGGSCSGWSGACLSDKLIWAAASHMRKPMGSSQMTAVAVMPPDIRCNSPYAHQCW